MHQERHEPGVGLRLDERDRGISSEQARQGLPHFRVRMNWQNDSHVGVLTNEIDERLADAFEGRTKAFPPVDRHEQEVTVAPTAY